jgi:class 3 adenylate cyclase/streptogramin lyase
MLRTSTVAPSHNRYVAELPHGSVTLLFTDVEGSTELQRRLGERYHEVVEAHRRLLDEAFTAHGGTVVDRQTESFFVVFRRARDAILAAASAQRALADHVWPDGADVKVRMGIHAGEPDVADDRYVGLAVSRAARICAAAHGGQVLLSNAARALLGDDERGYVRRLGTYRLKDFPVPEPISQLVIDGLPNRFPPLRTGAERGRRRRLLLVGAGVLVLAAAIAGTWAAIAGDSGLSSIGPTSVGVIEPTKSKLVDEIELGFKSSLIAAGEGHVWVADPGGSTLVKIDPRTRKIVSRLGVEAGSLPIGLAVGHGAVWLAVLRGTRRIVLELGPQFGELRREIGVGGRLELGDNAIWVIDATTGGLWRIDPRNGRPSKLAEGLSASSLASTPQALWVAGLATVTKVDPVTGLELDEIAIGSQPGEVGSVAAGHGAVWFTSSASSTLWRIDPLTDAATRTFPVGKGPSAVAVGDGAVWVANSRDGSVTRIDRRGNVQTIRTGSTPAGIVAANGQIWITSGDPRA